MSVASDEIIEILESVLGEGVEPIGLHEPHFDGNELKYLEDCINTGWVSSVGTYVDMFSEKLAEACGVKHAIPTVNGTAALHISMLLSGVSPNDEVLLPSLTFVATANAIKYCNATPHFMECEAKTLCLDVPKLQAYLSEIAEKKSGGCYNKRTGQRIAAIIPVHVFGHAVDMDALQIVADKYGIPVIADAAEALGSVYKDKPLTSYGLLSAVSFNGNKIITTGGGGAILTDNDDLAARAKHLTTTAKKLHKWEYIHDEIGYNYRLPNINAAIGCAQLEQLHAFLKSKERLAKKYQAAFEKSENFKFIGQAKNSRSNNWLNAVILNEGLDRDEILGALHDSGFLCRPVWRLMHNLDIYKDCPRMDLTVSENMEARIINIPSSAKLAEQLC